MKLFKTKSGFTLIELLVVIGILAVLVAIAIPSVAGLIDRANVSADKTNANEMTNAIERFAAEYELYCQDIASGVITADTTDFDAAQGRVYNVTQVKTRAGISDLEVASDATVEDDVLAIYRDTKYPVNAKTMQAIVENYTKTSSATFEPKQSDMHYWYSPACGVVVVATPESSIADRNAMIQSGKDAKGRELDDANEVWIDLTADVSYVANNNPVNPPVESGNKIPAGGTYKTNVKKIYIEENDYMIWDESDAIILPAGEAFPASPSYGDIYTYGEYEYCYGFRYCSCGDWWHLCGCYCDGDEEDLWAVHYIGTSQQPGPMLSTINGKNVTSMMCAFFRSNITKAPEVPNTITDMNSAFGECANFTQAPIIPNSVTNMHNTFYGCTSLTQAPVIPQNVDILSGTFQGCTSLTGTITIHASPSYYYAFIYDTRQEIVLTGTSNVLNELAAEADYNNVTVG